MNKPRIVLVIIFIILYNICLYFPWFILVLTPILVYPQINSKFELHYQKTDFNQKIIEKCPMLQKQKFYPTPWFPFGKMHLYFGHFFDRKTAIRNIYKRELLTIPKQGQVTLDWVNFKQISNITAENVLNRQKNPTIVMILTGMGSTSYTRHIRNLCIKLASFKGSFATEIVVYHPRGMHGSKYALSKPPEFHAKVEDFANTVENIQNRYPDHKIYAIGQSFGGNILANYLGKFKKYIGIEYMNDFKGHEELEKCLLSGAVLISPAINVAQHHMHVHENEKFIETRITAAFKKKVLIPFKNQGFFKSEVAKELGLDFEKCMKAKNTFDLYEYFGRKIFGYKSLQDYYKNEDFTQRIEGISTPALFLFTKDDPVIPIQQVPKNEFLNNKHIVYVELKTGSHLGIYSGLYPQRWCPDVICEFIGSLVLNQKF